MKEKIVKGLIQAISVFLTTLGAGFSLLVAALTGLANLMFYLLSNLLWVSDSPQGQLGIKDWVKALLLAGCGGLSAYLVSLTPGVEFVWKAFFVSALTAMMAYIAPTYTQGKK